MYFLNEFYGLICFHIVSVLSFQVQEFSNISCEAGLVVMNSFIFCLSGNVFNSPSFLKDSFTRYSILGWQFFVVVQHIGCIIHFVLAWKVSLERSIGSHMGVPLYMTSLDAFFSFFQNSLLVFVF